MDRLQASQKKAAAAAEQQATSETAATEAKAAAEEATNRLAAGEIKESEAKAIVADAAKKQAQAEKDAAAAADLNTRAERDNERAAIAAAAAKLAQAAAFKKASDVARAANEGGASSAAPFVEPTVKVYDHDEIKRETDEAKRDLDELGAKTARPKVTLDDGDFKAKAAEDGAAAGEAGGHMSLMAAAIASIAVAAPGTGALLGGLAGAGATVGLAFSGVKQALTDYSAAQSAVGQNAAQVAQTEFANATAIKAAEQGIADARRAAAQQAISSAEAVVNAEQGLQNAEISEQFAQVALTQARKDAALQLQQLNDQEKDSKLSVEAASLALQQAEINARQINQSNVTTALQREQANLAVAQAQQALREAQERATNSTNAANLANKQGVEGNPSVVQAKNAERLAVQGIGNAQQALGDAVRNAANSQVSSQEAVRKAIQNLADTQKNQQLQAAVTAASNAQAATQFARDMAKMTSAGRTFVNELINVKSNIHSLSATAQTAFLPGVTAFLQGAQTLMPIFNSEAKAMGGILGGQFSAVGQALRSANIQGEIKTIFAEGNQLVKVLGPAIGGLAKELLSFFAAGAPAAAGLSKGLAAIVNGFSGLFKALEPAAGAFGVILKTLGEAIGALGVPIGQIIGALATALAPALAGLLPGFKALTAALGQGLSIALKALAPGLGILAKAISSIAIAVAPLLPVLGKLIAALAGQLATILQPLANLLVGLVQALQPLFGLIGPLAGVLVTLVKDALGPVAALIKELTPIIVTLVKAWVSFAVDALKPVMPMISQVAGLLGKVLMAVVPLLPPIVQFAATLGEDWVKALTPLLPQIMKFVEQLLQAGAKVLPQLMPQIKQLTVQFQQMLQQLMPMLPGLMQLSTLFLELAVKALPALLPILIAMIKGLTLAEEGILALDRLILDGLMLAIKALTGGFKDFASNSKKAWADVTKYVTQSVKETWQNLKQWWSDVTKIYNDSFAWLKNTYTSVTTWLTNLWRNWLQTTKNNTLQLWTDLRSSVTNFFSDLGRIFGSGISALGTIWQRLDGVFKAPVNFLISQVYMNGIRRLWDDVAGAIGLSSINLPVVATLAAGGTVPAEPGIFNKPTAIVGEGDPHHPEYVIPTDPKHRDRAQGLWAQAGHSLQMLAGGGIIGDITGGIGGFLSGVWNSAKFLASFASDPVKAVEGLLDKAVSTSAKGELGQMMTKLPEALIAKLAGYAKANAASGGAAAMVTTAKSYLGKGDIFSAMVGRPVEEWCADYVDAIAKITGNSSVVPSTASAPAKASMFHDAGEFHSGIQGALPGDIFFASHGGSGDIPGVYHTGIITAPSNGQSLISIAGNTGANDVAMENWSPGEIAGFGRPKYLAGSGSYTGGSLLRPSPSDAQGWARQTLEKAGQGGQFPSLLDLWNRESGWRWDATNPSSGAYGIPQSLPASKMASAGSDWMDNAATQIKWGLDYIAGRYHNPDGAVAHENAYGWYDQGGWVQSGSAARNASGKPEAVLTPEESKAFVALVKALVGQGGSGGAAAAVHQENHFHGSSMASPEELAALSIHLQTAVGGS